MTIFENEPVHYTGERHLWNNGFRRRWLANGEENAAVINAARRGDLDAVIARVQKMGGVGRGALGVARSIIRAAQKLDGDVPGHKVVHCENGVSLVCTPYLGWCWQGRRRVGVIEWEALWRVPTPARLKEREAL